ARGVVLVAVGQDAEHQVGLGNHAVVARTVLRRLETAAAIEVDVVPLGRAFGDYGVGVAQFVGPGGDAGQGRVGLGGEQAVDLGAGRGREAGLGDAGDDAVAFGAPGQGVAGEQGAGKREEGEAPVHCGDSVRVHGAVRAACARRARRGGSEAHDVGGAVDQRVDLRAAQLHAVEADVAVDVHPAHVDADRALFAELEVDAGVQRQAEGVVKLELRTRKRAAGVFAEKGGV